MLRGTGLSRVACFVFATLTVTAFTLPLQAFAAADEGTQASDQLTIERATGEKLAEAIGHYARSRSLLVQALREFDRARLIAKPDSLIDSDEWRATLLSRAEELEKILSPQPRASKGGVRFDSAQQLLKSDGNGE